MLFHATFSNGWGRNHIEADSEAEAWIEAESEIPQSWKDDEVCVVAIEPDDTRKYNRETLYYLDRIASARQRYAAEFRDIFHVEIDRFWSPLTAFDIVAFDAWIKTPDGVSCKEQTRLLFGERAAELIETLVEV